MKASDLLAIIKYNDPQVLSRVQKVKSQLKQLKSYESCDSCGSRVHYEYRRATSEFGDELLVEGGTCQGCFAKVPTRAFAIH